MTHLTRMDPAALGTTGSATILVVDDSRTSLNSMGEQLGQSGYMVVLCDRGSDALDLIAGCRFDLVILDLLMPEMSGLQVMSELRASPETADLPVIVVTSCTDPQVARQVLALDADDLVAKPYVLDVLTARIDRILRRAERISELKRANAALDGRIAERAIELGETRDRLNAVRADRDRLAASLETLSRHVHTLTTQTSAGG